MRSQIRVARKRSSAWARRAAIMDRVRPLLDALDAEYADRLRATGEEAERLEEAAREAVLAYGASFRHAGVHAVYNKPRVTWDGKGLAEYAETHPEVAAFRRVGKPSVSLRFQGPPDDAPAPASAGPIRPAAGDG